MEELLACRVCLATEDVKLYSFHINQLSNAYQTLTGIQVLVTDGLPHYICSYCSSLLLKSVTFKQRCSQSQDLLNCLKLQNALSMGFIGSLHKEIQNVLPYGIAPDQPVISCQHDYNMSNEQSLEHESTIKEEEELEAEIEADTEFNDGSSLAHYVKSLQLKYNDLFKVPKKKKKKQKCKTKKENNMETLNSARTVGILVHPNEEQTDVFINDVVNEETVGSESEEIDSQLKDVEVVNLTREEQLKEIEDRKSSFNYTNSAFKCNKCYKGFITDLTYRNHMKKHDPNNGQYECDICFSRWLEPRSLKAHMVNSHKRKFICKICDFVSRSSHRAREHSKWHMGFTYVCKICGASFAKSTSHLTHMRLQHPSNHACDICGESFIGDVGLRMHKKLAHKDEVSRAVVFCCGQCAVEFQTIEALQRHVQLAVDGLCNTQLRSCPHCGEGFQSDEDLSEHTKTHHEVEADSTPRVQCGECKRSFASEKSYTTHYQRVHLGVRLKQYKPCLKRPSQSVVCEICGKRCITKATLRYHQRIHSGEKPFQCTVCPKKFSVFQQLQIHIRTHTGESPYQCKHCPKAFKHKAALNRHDRVHTGVKPYACPHCGKAFSQSNSMKLHVNTVHFKMPAPYRSRRTNKN